jgi:hypothetical protein
MMGKEKLAEIVSRKIILKNPNQTWETAKEIEKGFTGHFKKIVPQRYAKEDYTEKIQIVRLLKKCRHTSRKYLSAAMYLLTTLSWMRYTSWI